MQGEIRKAGRAPTLRRCFAQISAGQPQTLVITAEYDPLRDEGEMYARRLREAGTPSWCCRMQDALHGYFSLPMGFAVVKRTYEIIQSFLNGDVDLWPVERKV